MQIIIEMANDVAVGDFLDFQVRIAQLCNENKHLILDRSLNFRTIQEKNRYLVEHDTM